MRECPNIDGVNQCFAVEMRNKASIIREVNQIYLGEIVIWGCSHLHLMEYMELRINFRAQKSNYRMTKSAIEHTKHVFLFFFAICKQDMAGVEGKICRVSNSFNTSAISLKTIIPIDMFWDMENENNCTF